MEDADAFAAQTAQAEAEAATWAARLAAGEFDGAAGRTPAMDGSYDNPLQGTASMGFSHSPPVFQVDKGEDLVPILSAVLQKLVERDDQLAGASQHASFTVFHALKPPAITVHKYLQRIFQYAQCSRSCFIVALIYVDRIIQRNANFRITSLNVHRLLITSVMIAAKFFDDIYFDNAYYAKVGGIPTAEINNLELEFLFMINFTLNVTGDVYRQYEQELLAHHSASHQEMAVE